MTATGWPAVTTFASGLEADIAVARLEAAGIRAVLDRNDSVGIVGFGFQGATAQGVTVRVPAEMLTAARALLLPSSDELERDSAVE